LWCVKFVVPEAVERVKFVVPEAAGRVKFWTIKKGESISGLSRTSSYWCYFYLYYFGTLEGVEVGEEVRGVRYRLHRVPCRDGMGPYFVVFVHELYCKPSHCCFLLEGGHCWHPFQQ
jgi:hypothetical protein